MGPTQGAGDSQKINKTHIGKENIKPKAKSLGSRIIAHTEKRSGPTPAQSATESVKAQNNEHKLLPKKMEELVTPQNMLWDKKNRYNHYKDIISSGPEQAKILVNFFRYEAEENDQLLGNLPHPATFALALTILDTIKDPKNKERQWAQNLLITHANTKEGKKSIEELKKIPNTTFSLSSSIDELLQEVAPYIQGRVIFGRKTNSTINEYKALKGAKEKDNMPATEGKPGIKTLEYAEGESSDTKFKLLFQAHLSNYLGLTYSPNFPIEKGISNLITAIFADDINIQKMSPFKLNPNFLKPFNSFLTNFQNRYQDDYKGDYSTPEASHVIKESLLKFITQDLPDELRNQIDKSFIQDIKDMPLVGFIQKYNPNLYGKK